MGQQQLLLVILVTIIVGIATVVAINTFSSAADSANLDAVRQDIASIAAGAQGYYMKPEMLGGGGNSFQGLTLEDIAFGGTIDGSDATLGWNENGTYKLGTSGDANGISISADPASDPNYTEGTSGSASNTITATIQPDNLSY